MARPNPYDPPTFPLDTYEHIQHVQSFHAGLDRSLRRMISPFSKDAFLLDFGNNINPEKFGYTSVEQILIFRGCNQEGNAFSYDEMSALRSKAIIACAHLGHFTVSEFKQKWNDLFLTKTWSLKSFGFSTMTSFLGSLTGVEIVETQAGRVKYYLPRRLHPFWKYPDSLSESSRRLSVAKDRANRIAIFRRNAPAFAKELGVFQKHELGILWRERSDIFPNLNPESFGFYTKEELFKTIPGVKFVSRPGEAIKYYFHGSDIVNGGDGSDEEVDKKYLKKQYQAEYKDVLEVAKKLENPFTERQLQDALVKYYRVADRAALVRLGERKVPVFLDTIPEIRYIHGGLYEHDGVGEKGDEAMDSEESDDSSSDDGDEKEKRKKGNVANLGSRALAKNDIIELGSSSEGSDDSEEEDSSSSGDDVSRNAKQEPVKVVRKRTRSRPIHIDLVSSDDEDEQPAAKKTKGEKHVAGEPGPRQEVAQGQTPIAGIARLLPPVASHSNQDSFNSMSSSFTNLPATGIPLQMMPPMFPPGPIPNDQLLQIAGQLQQILMQQGVPGGPVPYMMPGQQPLPLFPPFVPSLQNSSTGSTGNTAAQNSIPPVDPVVNVKKETISSDNPPNSAPSGSVIQAPNCHLQPMNPDIQNFWSPQMPYVVPQMPPPMFHTGFPGGYGAPGLPGFGLPPQMLPNQPQVNQMTALPTHNLPNNIMDFLCQYMGPALPTALQNGANPLDLAKKLLEDAYGNQQKPPPQL